MSTLRISDKNEEYRQMPDILRDYAEYALSIHGSAHLTVCEYLLDLRTFFRYYIMSSNDGTYEKEEFEKISIKNIDVEDLKKITERTIIRYLMFARVERENGSSARLRKISAIRSFFHYATTKKHWLEVNPALEIDSPKKGKTVPKYLSVAESLQLLEAVKNDTESKTVVRDYAIICLFLNTGMRLSELVGLNITSFDADLSYVKVIGKGNKERVIYLNNAARAALEDHLRIRLDPKFIRTSDAALFLSGREQRISNKTVQYIVYKYLRLAGLGAKEMSVHKLRHTAATLMYQTGNVDVRLLKDILGHEQLNTTQIYTHVVESSMQDAMDLNPLADVEIKRKRKSAEE